MEVKDISYTNYREIGKGGYGIIYKAIISHNREKVAHKGILDGIDEYYFLAELTLLQMVKGHPGFVQLKYWSYKSLFLEKMKFSLSIALSHKNSKFNYIMRVNMFPSFLYQILSALEYIHGKNIYHNDLSPNNILVSDDYKTYKLCDFGVSGTAERCINTSHIGGSYQVSAPETLLFDCDGNYNEYYEEYNMSLSDIWSLGICSYFFLHRCYPFPYKNNITDMLNSIYEKYSHTTDYPWGEWVSRIKNKKETFFYCKLTNDEKECLSIYIVEVIESMLKADCASRSTIDNIMKTLKIINDNQDKEFNEISSNTYNKKMDNIGISKKVDENNIATKLSSLDINDKTIYKLCYNFAIKYNIDSLVDLIIIWYMIDTYQHCHFEETIESNIKDKSNIANISKDDFKKRMLEILSLCNGNFIYTDNLY